KRAKGLAAKLTGPAVNDENPVILSYFITATDSKGYINLSKKRINLESSLKNVISVSCVFMVFYEDRAVSISDFYLHEDYRYNLNDQYENFRFQGNVYRTDYPFGWGITKAFQYLKKEIN
ncbi:MAG: hypothetical protein JXJ04_04630, partial [Spirochaetales bacterium]|nr:hypothetical protein [Spirochaetales bacterium]